MSGDQLRSGNEVERSRGQHRHVQGLADVAGGFGTACMMVEQAAARGKIEQDDARQHRERPARHRTSEYSSTWLHDPTLA